MKKQTCGLFLTAVLALTVSAAASAPAADWSPALQAVIAKAKVEGQIQLSSSPNVLGGADGARIVGQSMKTMFGVDLPVTWSPAPAMGALTAKIYEEFSAGNKASTDLFSVSAVQAVPYLSKSLFLKVDWPALLPGRIPPEATESDGRALRIGASFPGILYNPRLAPWVKDIASMADLLKPQYKGEFATTAFLAGFDALAAKDAWGIGKTLDYVRKLAPQVSGLLRCSSEDRVVSGEFPAVALDCIGGGQFTDRFRGKGVIDTKIVADAAQRRYYYIFIPANSPHPNAAILYALYLSTPEGQQGVLLAYDGMDLDLYPESITGKREQALKAEGVTFIDVTMDWWAKAETPDVVAAQAAMTKIIAQNK